MKIYQTFIFLFFFKQTIENLKDIILPTYLCIFLIVNVFLFDKNDTYFQKIVDNVYGAYYVVF